MHKIYTKEKAQRGIRRQLTGRNKVHWDNVQNWQHDTTNEINKNKENKGLGRVIIKVNQWRQPRRKPNIVNEKRKHSEISKDRKKEIGKN